MPRRVRPWQKYKKFTEKQTMLIQPSLFCGHGGHTGHNHASDACHACQACHAGCADHAGHASHVTAPILALAARRGRPGCLYSRDDWADVGEARPRIIELRKTSSRPRSIHLHSTDGPRRRSGRNSIELTSRWTSPTVADHHFKVKIFVHSSGSIHNSKVITLMYSWFESV